MHDNLLIARKVRQTISYIEKNIYNFPNSHIVLKNRIISSCYDILEAVYRANIDQDCEYKKVAIVRIQMLNFYLKSALDSGLITKKKFLSYSKHLLDIHRMLLGWLGYEEG